MHVLDAPAVENSIIGPFTLSSQRILWITGFLVTLYYFFTHFYLLSQSFTFVELYSTSKLSIGKTQFTLKYMRELD